MTESPSIFFKETVPCNQYEYYLGDDILGSPDEYASLCHTLRSMTPNDTMTIRINCNGGRLDSTISICNAIHESQGQVVGHIEYACQSAASFIFLACNSWAVSEDAFMMIHSATYGIGGKENEVKSEFDFKHPTHKKLFKRFYKDFLTPKEIKRILQGLDKYLDSDEILKRITSKAEIMKAEAEESESEEELELD